jgi:hypothetical protein
MWGSNTWRSYKESLIRASLLVFKPQEDILMLLPFMNAKASELLEDDGEEKKIEFHLKWWKFYKDYCMRTLEKVGDSDFDMNEFVEKESNIWACIYRSINRIRDDMHYDEETEEGQGKLFNSFKLDNTAAFMNFNSRIKPNQKLPFFENRAVDEIAEDEDEDNTEQINVIQPSSKTIHEENWESTDYDGNFLHTHSNTSNHTSNREGTHFHASRPNKSKSNKPKLSSEHFKEEEMMVVYYVATVIRLSKISDGFKAIEQYKKKISVSKLWKAHIYKLLGVLNMLSEQKNYNTAKRWFKKSLEWFSKIDCMRGFAITKLALLRCNWEIEFNKSSNFEELKQAIAVAEKWMIELGGLGYKVGQERAKLYIDCLKNKYSGEDIGNFKKTLKFKSIRIKNFMKTNIKASLLNNDIIQDEDIKLFVEVIEESLGYDN